MLLSYVITIFRISSDPPDKDGNVRFTTVPSKAFIIVKTNYFNCGFSTKVTGAFYYWKTYTNFKFQTQKTTKSFIIRKGVNMTLPALHRGSLRIKPTVHSCIRCSLYSLHINKFLYFYYEALTKYNKKHQTNKNVQRKLVCFLFLSCDEHSVKF